MPSGISQNGRWKYAYIYQTVQNEVPELIEQSVHINKENAMITILRSYFRSNGTRTAKEIQKLLGWREHDIQKALNSLITNREIIQTFTNEDKGKGIFANPELI